MTFSKILNLILRYKLQLALFVIMILTNLMFPITAFATDNIAIEIYGWKFGQFNSQDFSLPLVTFFIALIDGFNPCAMSILLFLISILLEMKETWKRWYLGGVFLVTSSFSYFLFLASWLKINEFIGLIPITRALIAVAAWVIGLWTLNQWWENRQKATGCQVSEQENSRKMFSKITEVLHRQNLFWATLGIVVLAFSVNLFELLCSAALPATYTNILAGSGVDGVAKLGYLLLYVLVFMLDDLLVFSIAMITLHATGITNKYNNLVKLISGIIMLVLAFWITVEVMQGLQII